MLPGNKSYNDNYYIIRKQILEEFLVEEEKDSLKYIEDIENLVSSTKLCIKGVMSGEDNYTTLSAKLQEIEKELIEDCDIMEQSMSTLNTTDKHIEMSTQELQKEEEKGKQDYLTSMDELKRDMEIKEFKIQNMERLYVELEGIIKENIKQGNEQLLSLEQFTDFISQNTVLKEECDALEAEKRRCVEDYNNLLRENVNLRSKDESFELEKVKIALIDMSTTGHQNKEKHRQISSLQTRFAELSKECKSLTSQMITFTQNLEGLNLENSKLNKEIKDISRQLLPGRTNLSHSFSDRINDNLFQDLEDFMPNKNK